jgi:hypothetical protein
MAVSTLLKMLLKYEVSGGKTREGSRFQRIFLQNMKLFRNTQKLHDSEIDKNYLTC